MCDRIGDDTGEFQRWRRWIIEANLILSETLYWSKFHPLRTFVSKQISSFQNLCIEVNFNLSELIWRQISSFQNHCIEANFTLSEPLYGRKFHSSRTFISKQISSSQNHSILLQYCINTWRILFPSSFKANLSPMMPVKRNNKPIHQCAASRGAREWGIGCCRTLMLILTPPGLMVA